MGDSNPNIKAVSTERWRASAREKRLYGGSTVTAFYVWIEGDDSTTQKVVGYGRTPGDRKTDAIRKYTLKYAQNPGPTMIIIDVTEDRSGNVLLAPRNKRVRSQMRRHNKEWIGHADSTVFLQEGGPASEFLDTLNAQQRREVERGWTVGIKMDPWHFGHHVGYDFHEVINP
jgi:hypothetical protein